jgi:hypothetical protein
MRYLLPILLFSLFQFQVTGQDRKKPNPDPERFRDEIDAFIDGDAKNSPPKNPVLFIGSSSIRLWKTHEAFPDYKVVNRGFGGAHISDMIFYYNEIAKPFNPEVVVFYCGDNDIADGKPVEQVYHDFVDFTDDLTRDFPDVKFIYLPVKPSQSRWSFYPKMREFNNQIEEFCEKRADFYFLDTATPLLRENGRPDPIYFAEDELHLNENGYMLWNQLLEPLLHELAE